MTFSLFVLLQDVHDDKQRHSMDSQDDQKKFAKLHYGQNHGRESLLPIEPMKFIGCALHLQLSVMRTLWEDAVCVHLTGHTKQQRVDAVNSKLSELRVHP